MKLTKYMREAFVRAAMQDVPQVDYSEAIRKAVVDAFLAQCPPLIQRAWADNNARPFVKTISWHCEASGTVAVPWDNTYTHPKTEHIASQEARTAVIELVRQANEQRDRLSKLRSNLAAVSESCSTRAQLVKALPEFERYLPADEEKAIRSVPAIANVVTDFVAAGWPKGKAPA